MAERIVVRVEVDGVELSPVEFSEGKQSSFYKDDMTFYQSGRLLNKERTAAPYSYMFSLSRHKTEVEKLKERG